MPHHASRNLRNLALALVAVLLSAVTTAFPATLQALWPALVALILVFTSRNAPFSLSTACCCAVVILFLTRQAELGQWVGTDGALWNTLLSPWHVYALLFTLLLGALASIVERGGGLLRLLPATGETTPRNRRRFLTSVFGLGLLCFFDGLANALMLGRVTRPAADRLRIPRAFLAYVVDTTSSAVACLAFLSTWIVTQLAYITDHSPLETPAYGQFLASVPMNFYCLFGLFLALLAVRCNGLIGPMKTREAVPLKKLEQCDALEHPGSLASALVPIVVLLFTLPLAILLLHRAEQGSSGAERIQQALNAPTVPLAFVLASALAVITALSLFPAGRWREAPKAALLGVRQLLPAVMILLMAWILGSLFGVLGTAEVLSGTLGSRLPLAALPAGVFLTGCLISFVSGSSWGTMGLLMPLALPLTGSLAAAQQLPPETLQAIVPAVIGAVFGGAVFGDHCSPYSDTTIVSALACGISTHEHTVTQLPYALLTAGAALILGYLPVALGLSPLLALFIGGAVISCLLPILSRSRRNL